MARGNKGRYAEGTQPEDPFTDPARRQKRNRYVEGTQPPTTSTSKQDQGSNMLASQLPAKSGIRHSETPNKDKPTLDLTVAETAATKKSKSLPDNTDGLNLYSPTDTEISPISKLRGLFVGRKKYGWGLGVGITGLLIMMFLAIPALGPHQMTQTLDNFHLAPNYNTRTIRNARFTKNILSRAIRGGTDAVTKKLNAIDPVDLETHLAKNGLTINYDGSGNPKSVTNTINGATEDLTSRRGAKVLDDALPSVKASRRGFFKKYTQLKTGFSWKSLFKNLKPDESIWTRIRSNRNADIDGRPITDEDGVSTTDGVDADGNPIPKDADLISDSNTGNLAVDEGIDVTNRRLAAGDTPSVALEKGTNAAFLKAPKPKSIVIGSLVLSCTSKAVYDNQLQVKYTNFKEAMFTGLELLMIRDEIENGNPETAKHIGDFMEQYNNKNGSFASSAAYQIATGQDVTGPGLNPENDVSGSINSQDVIGSILGLVSGAGGLITHVPLLSQFCGVVNLAAGTLIGNWLLTGVDVVIGATEIILACNPASVTFTGGVSCAAKTGAQVFFSAVLPRLIGIIVSSTVQKIIENPEQAFNFASHSMAVLGSEMNRTGKPVTEEEYIQGFNNYQREEAKDRTLFDRYFAMDSPTSVTRSLATWKTQFGAASFKDKMASVVYLPANLIGSVADIFTDKSLAADGVRVDPHASIQRYLLDNEYLYMAEDEVARQALLLMDGAGDKAEAARNTAAVCMGYDYDAGEMKPELQLPLFSNPGVPDDIEDDNSLSFFSGLVGAVTNVSGTASNKNDLVADYCKYLNQGIDADEYALIGRYVDDVKILDGLKDVLDGPTQ